MSRDEKLGYNISRYGTQGLGMGSMLMARAPAVAEVVMASPTGAGRILDNLARPYTAAPDGDRRRDRRGRGRYRRQRRQ
jgi:hypothetical protein